MGFEADAWQVQGLRSTAKRQAWLVGRQLGKSVCAAMKALHRVAFTPGSEVLISSIGERQSLLLFDKCTAFYDKLRPVPEVKRLRTELHLSNGSRLIALPGDAATARGYSPNLIVLDEASRIDEGMLAAVTPMLAETDGDLLILSTPAGRRGFFYAVWSDETQEWERITARRIDYPHRVKPGFLESERRTLGPALFAQEHETAFIEDGDQVLADVAIEAIKRWDRPGIAVLTALEAL